MVTVTQTNDAMLRLWVYLWKNSVPGQILPQSIWNQLITPRWVAILLWFISTLQIIWPLSVSVPWPGSRRASAFPTRNAEYNMSVCPERGEILFHGQQQPEVFRPELYYHDFPTFWSKLVKGFLEVWGFQADSRTYRESVAHLALASGLRYTGSVSLSYPRQRIREIIKFKQGYFVKRSSCLEPLPHGWELRALKEFQKLARCHGSRVFVIMVCKLALQMNLQITFFIIARMENSDTVASTLFVEMISLVSLILNFIMELLDVKDTILMFFHVRHAVIGTVLKVGDSGRYFAVEELVADAGEEGPQKLTYSGRDLKAEYYLAVRYIWKICLMTLLSMWLIGYIIIEFSCVMFCEHGAWEMNNGCLPSVSEEHGNVTSCFRQIFIQT